MTSAVWLKFTEISKIIGTFFNITIAQGCDRPILNLKPSMDSQDCLDANSGV